MGPCGGLRGPGGTAGGWRGTLARWKGRGISPLDPLPTPNIVYPSNLN